MEIAHRRKQHDDKKEEIDTGLFIYSASRYHPNYSMAQPTEAFLLSLHACQTVEHFYDKVLCYYSCQPQESRILDDHALHISRIAVYKQHALVQHEAIIITLGTPGHNPDCGFNILVDRTVNFATLARGFSTLCLCQKVVVDRLQCVPTARPPWISSASRVWTMARTPVAADAPGHNSDRLNLLHVALLLRTVSAEAGARSDTLGQNCFWFTWAVRESLRLLIHDKPELGTVEITEKRPCCCFLEMGTCFGFSMGRPTHCELEDTHRAFHAAYTSCRDEVSHSCIWHEGSTLNPCS